MHIIFPKKFRKVFSNPRKVIPKSFTKTRTDKKDPRVLRIVVSNMPSSFGLVNMRNVTFLKADFGFIISNKYSRI